MKVPIQQISLEERKEIRQKWLATRRLWAGHGNSLFLGDNMVLLRAVGAAEYANSEGKLEKFCIDYGLRHKAVIEIRKLRLQLTNEIKKNLPEVEVFVDPKLKPPTDLQVCNFTQEILKSNQQITIVQLMINALICSTHVYFFLGKIIASNYIVRYGRSSGKENIS